jgi:hypothetical protein
MAGKSLPGFNDVAQLPGWAVDQNRREIVLRITALLYYRQQIDQEINGRKLAQLADVFGEQYLDLACSADLPDANLLASSMSPMPTPDAMLARGAELLASHREPGVAPLVAMADALFAQADRAGV